MWNQRWYFNFDPSILGSRFFLRLDWTGLPFRYRVHNSPLFYPKPISLIKARYLQLCLYNPAQCVTSSVTNLWAAERRKVVELISVGRGVTMRAPEFKYFCRNFCPFSQCLVVSFRYYISYQMIYIISYITYQIRSYHIWYGMIYIWYDIWYDMIWWYDMIYNMRWYDMIYDMIFYDMMILYDTIWYDMIWYDMIYDMIWYDTIRYDMIHDTIWYDIWYDMIRYYIILYYIIAY